MILNSPYITGSLTVTGNTILQGALTVTGSLSGTAATASFALTLGGTGSVGFATTGAFTATSGSASSRLTQIEQVYATTGSNSFRATQSITGSLTVTGQIVAQTLNVQQVTSSIVFSSGSNVFGSDLNSRQTFTGSVLITGSLVVNTTGPELQVTNTGVILGNLLTDNHSITGSLRITGSSVTLTGALSGTSATFSGNVNLQGAVTRNINFYDSSNTNINAQIQYDQISSNSGQLFFGTNNAGTFATRLTISNTGAATFANTVQANGAFRQFAGTGYFADFAYNGTTYNLGSSETTDNVDFKIAGGGSFTSGGNFRWFTQTGGATPIQALRITTSGNLEIGTATKASFSYLALINDANTNGGVIGIARSSGQFLSTAGAGDMIIGNSTGENILFGNGQTGATEYVRITSGGQVGIGTTTITASSGYKMLKINGTTGGEFVLSANDVDCGYMYASAGIFVIDAVGNYPLRFRTNAGNRMDITGAGKVHINSPSDTGPRLAIKGTANDWTVGAEGSSTTGQSYGILVTAGTNNVDQSFYVQNAAGNTVYFRVRGDGLVSAIPTYNNTYGNAANMFIGSDGFMGRSTASSQRFKDNITNWNASGLDTILALKPKTFTYKKDYYPQPERQFLGLIAEDVAEVSSYLADFENEDGTGQVENVRYANIVVPLIKAIQEQQAEIEELKALIAAK
jgi:trimeric autotransporter adhesin